MCWNEVVQSSVVLDLPLDRRNTIHGLMWNWWENHAIRSHCPSFLEQANSLIVNHDSEPGVMHYLRWGSPEIPMKSAYLVAQAYANFCKMVLMVIILVPKFRILVLDPESRDGSNCHPYQSLEICIPLCNNPIGLIQKGHLKQCFL